MARVANRINSFGLRPGRVIGGKYTVEVKLGSGWEGEVYRVVERRTGIERAAKLFYPQRNVRDRTARLNARKLHTLRDCPLVIQYHSEEVITVQRTPVTVLISELVEGQLLTDFLEKLPGKRLAPFEALHLLHRLVMGLEEVHAANEYHGDLHSDNIIVEKYGLEFGLKLVDFFHQETPKVENRRGDILDAIRLFYDATGGRRFYAKQPDAVKYICCGLKRSLTLQKFRTMAQLRKHLETMTW